MQNDKASGKVPVFNDDVAGKIVNAKQQLERMIDLTPQIMLLVDSQGVILRANKATLEFLGLADFTDVLGARIYDLFKCGAQDIWSRLLIGEARNKTEESDIHLQDGTARTVKCMAIASGSGAGAYVVIVYDITDDKQREQVLEKKHKLEAVKALTGALMHNINQYLTVIMVRSQLMSAALAKEDCQLEEMRGDLEEISSLSLKIAELLKAAENQADFNTEQYVDNVNILDIRTKSGKPQIIEDPCMRALKTLSGFMNVHEETYTKHVAATAKCAVCLSDKLGMSEEDKRLCHSSGLLHDIGKLAVPGHLLRKPGKLNFEEKKKVEKHTEYGYRLLSSFPFLDVEAKVAGNHHERYDGCGYPRGLGGKDISLITRIISVADAFDAMRMNRPYDKQRPFDKVFEEIKKGSGSQFDPEVISAFELCAEEMDSFILL